MAKYLNKNLWDQHIFKEDWYLKLEDEFKNFEKIKENLSEKDEEDLKEELYSYIENKLGDGTIPLSEAGPDWDDERKPIDTIIIHHTSHDKPLTLSRLNTKHLLRLYMPFFQNPNDENKAIKGNAISSGHFVRGKQVFYGYHWFVRLDGSTERLLKDEYIGWHAGNWDINTRSIAICIDGNFENNAPNIEILRSIANLIKNNYKNINATNIMGHNEVNKNTICPGNKFLSEWRKTLLKLVNNNV